MFSRRAVVRGLVAGSTVVGTARSTDAETARSTDAETARSTDAEETDTSTETASAASGDAAPVYRYDAGNTGVTDATGPTASPSVRWRRTFSGPLFAPPAVGDGRLYQPVGDGQLFALETAGGRRQWHVETPRGLLTTPALAESGVLLANENRTVQSLERDGGTAQWAVPTVARGGGQCAPALANGLVYTGGADGLVHGFDVETGRPHWELRLPDAVVSSLAVADDRLFVAAGRTVFAVDATRVPEATAVPRGIVAATREPVWRTNFDTRIGSAVAVRDGRVVVGTDDGVMALAADDGSRRWKTETRTPVPGSPAVADDRIVVATAGGGLLGLAPDGEELWRANFGVRLDTSPVVADGICYLAAENVLAAVGTANGGLRWRVRREGSTPATPVAVDGRLYVTDWNGTLAAFE
jgi:outer membrane protein assembly factor BamB